MLTHVNKTKVVTRQRLIMVSALVSIAVLVAVGAFLFGTFGVSHKSSAALGSNMGFENSLTEWTQVSGAWSANSNVTYIRTGSKSAKVTLAASGVAELKNTNCTVTAPLTGTNYITVIAWAKASTASYGNLKVGYADAVTGVKTLATSYTTLNNSTFTQVQAVLAVTNGATVVPFISASASSVGGSDVYVDDVTMYSSTSSAADNTAPSAPSGVSATVTAGVNTLTWTNGTDGESGIGGVLVLRQSGIIEADQAVNNQTTYSATSSSVGATSAGSWTVVYSGSAVTTLVDAAGAGTYTYLIYMRDNAMNYTTYTSAARIFVVNASASVSLSANASIDGLYLPSTSTLTVGSSYTLAIRSTASINLYGTLVHQGNIVNNGTVNMQSGSLYRFDRDGDASSNIMTATWGTGSTCELKGLKNYVPGNLNQTFYHFKWNCTQQNSALTVTSNITTLGNATFQDTGSGASIKPVYMQGTLSVGGVLNVTTATADLEYQPNTSLSFTGSTQQQLILYGTNPKIKKVTVNNAGGVKLMQNVTIDSSINLSQGNLDLNGFTLYTTDSTNIVCNGGSVTNGTITRSPNNPNGMYNLQYLANYTPTGLELTTSTNYLRNLLISGQSPSVTLDKSAHVNGKLILAHGKFITGSYEVYVRNNSANALNEADGDAYVCGNLRRDVTGSGTYGFPVGSLLNRELATIKFNSLVGVSSILGTFSSTFTGTATLCWVNGSRVNTPLDQGYWTMTPNQQPTGGTYDITIDAKGYTNPASSAMYYAVIKRDNATSAWKSLGTHVNGTQSMANGKVTAKRSGLTSFSDFEIAYGNAVLPITLSAFDASLQNDQSVKLTWHTSAELNNAYFDLERSTNGTDFELINEQAGAGTSTEAHDYDYTDATPPHGTVYYRLKQTDFDGNFTYSMIRQVGNGANGVGNHTTETFTVNAFPNPGNGLFTFTTSTTRTVSETVTVKVFDVKGQLVTDKTFVGDETMKLDLTAQPPGIYMATVSDANNHTVTKQLIIQR